MIGHNIEGERERLYERFQAEHEQVLRLGRQSVAAAVRAGKVLVSIRAMFPPRSGWMEWCRVKGIGDDVANNYLLLGAHIPPDAEYATVNEAVDAARDERDRIKAAEAQAEADRQREVAQAAEDAAVKARAEKAAADAERKAEKADQAVEKREQARAVANEESGGDYIQRYSPDRPSANEWYTPAHVIEAARQVMGGIDLDPASCETAQEVVRAERWYGVDDDGLDRNWSGRVWMNPPYSLKGEYALDVWITRLQRDFRSGAVDEAVMLINNVADSQAGASALAESSAACFTCPRLKFKRPGAMDANPPLGQMILLYSHREEAVAEFARVFGGIGTVVVPWRDTS